MTSPIKPLTFTPEQIAALGTESLLVIAVNELHLAMSELVLSLVEVAPVTRVRKRMENASYALTMITEATAREARPT